MKEYVLLLDSSDAHLTVGISLNNEIIYGVSFKAWQRQSEFMIPEIDKACKAINITLKDIDKVCVGIGPGSYTGVRIPLTIAKTLNVSTGAKIVPVSSLKIMGNSEEKYISLMNAKSGRSYIGVYAFNQCIKEDFIISNEEIDEFIKPYLAEGYVLKGSLEYLKKESSFDILKGLNSACNDEECSNTFSLKPVYLKD